MLTMCLWGLWFCVSFPLAGKVAVLLPVQQSAVFFQQWLSDDSLQAAVQAVLVDDTGEYRLLDHHMLAAVTLGVDMQQHVQ
jgi:hypothetical protein